MWLMTLTACKHRREIPELRREQILEEAIRIIGQRGYHAFTVQELAQRCGLTNGGMLYYFASKERLLIAVLEERERREAELIPAGVDFEPQDSGRNPSLKTVLQVLRMIIVRCVAQPEMVRLHTVLQSEALNSSHPAHKYFLRFEARVLGEFTKMVGPYVKKPRATARQLLALIDGLLHQWLRAGAVFDVVAEWDEAVAMVLPKRASLRGVVKLTSSKARS
jgi:AcrR family transcriptional regulator